MSKGNFKLEKESYITSMLIGVRSDCNKNFEVILLSNAVTYGTRRKQYHQFIASSKYFSERKVYRNKIAVNFSLLIGKLTTVFFATSSPNKVKKGFARFSSVMSTYKNIICIHKIMLG